MVSRVPILRAFGVDVLSICVLLIMKSAVAPRREWCESAKADDSCTDRVRVCFFEVRCQSRLRLGRSGAGWLAGVSVGAMRILFHDSAPFQLALASYNSRNFRILPAS